MTMDRVEVITSVGRRRRWSGAEKVRRVAAMNEPGAVVTEIARVADVGCEPSLSLAPGVEGRAQVADVRAGAGGARGERHRSGERAYLSVAVAVIAAAASTAFDPARVRR